MIEKNKKVSPFQFVSNIDSITDIFKEFGFIINITENGITNITTEECYLRDQYDFFEAIVPYIKDDSYIELLGEDGQRFRWWIKNNKLNEIYPKMIWENDKKEDL